MKNIKVKNIAFVSMVLAALALFTGCQDVIYANIRKEVKLRDASIKGDINSIIRYQNDFYCANGNIYRKSKDATSPGGWSKISSPSGYVISLAADNDYLYALLGISKEDLSEGENVPVRRELWCYKDGDGWKKVTGVFGSGDIAYKSGGEIKTNLFGTNAIASANRSAYFIVNGGSAGYKVYKLNGAAVATTWGSGTGETALSTTNADTKPTSSTQSCVYDGSAVRFFNSRGSCTNETNSAAPTIYYYGDSSTLRWGKKGTAPVSSDSVGAKSGVLSIGYTSNYLLVGTSAGISHHALSAAGVPSSSSTEFSTNAEATLSSQYNILAILVAQPEKSETETIIYASQNYTGSGSNSAQFNHICMWSYYPSTHEWNRE